MTGEQLKNSILQEAIEGKLVPQDPNDEPASKLLERIRKEKAQLAKEGKLKKAALVNSDIYRGDDGHWYEKSGKAINDISDEIPFDIPETWKWCRMQDVIEFINGKAYKREELLKEGKYKVLRVGNLFTNTKWYYSDIELPYDKYCYKGDLLYAWSASFGPKIWEGDKTIFHYHIWNVKYEERILYREFLYYFFLIDKTRIKGATTGSTMIHVSMENMKPRFIPIPPLEEQKRIVAKIEELMPYVERFGKAQTELDKLNKRLRPLLKKSVLQEAIEGKLVPQDPNDEPASKLLERIRKEKMQLAKEGKLKKAALANSDIYRGDDGHWYEKSGKAINDISDEIPFDIPRGWLFCRLSHIAQIIDGVKKKGEGILLDAKFLRGKSSPQLIKSGRFVQKGDDVILVDGENSGEIFTVPIDGYMGSTFKQLWLSSVVNIQFLLYNLLAYKEFLRKNKKGAAIPHLNKSIFYGIIVALPPLEEQKRIVAKIEEVFAQLQ